MAACWPLQMPPTQKAVLISLADNANDHGECWPSIKTIAVRTCFSERAVQNAIHWLEAAGALSADRSNGRHTRYVVTPNAYQTPAPAAPPQQVHPRSKCTTAAGSPPQQVPKPPQEIPKPPQEVPSNRKEPSRTVRKTRVRSSETTFDEWTDSLGGQDAILDTDPIYDWASNAGIPEDWVELAWMEFVNKHDGNPKRQADWRKTFRNYVKSDWLKIWRFDAIRKTYVLTTVGEQHRAIREANNRKAA